MPPAGYANGAVTLHAGYTLGFELVRQYLHQQDQPASRLYNEPAERFRCLAEQDIGHALLNLPMDFLI